MNAYKRYPILVLLTIDFAGSLASAGKLYSWVDENGQKQYGDRPPAGSNYTEKPMHTRPGWSNTTGQGGLRHGELGLLRKYDIRETDVMASRKAAARQYKSRKRVCAAATEKYNDALRNSRSRGIEYREQAKKLYHRMRDICF